MVWSLTSPSSERALIYRDGPFGCLSNNLCPSASSLDAASFINTCWRHGLFANGRPCKALSYFFSFMTLTTSSSQHMGKKSRWTRNHHLESRQSRLNWRWCINFFPSTHPISFLVFRLLWLRSNKGKKRQMPNSSIMSLYPVVTSH